MSACGLMSQKGLTLGLLRGFPRLIWFKHFFALIPVKSLSTP